MRGLASLLAVAALSAGALAVAAAAPAPPPPRPVPLVAAPEPAAAPAGSAPPAGTVLPLGVPVPEGIVVTQDGLAVAATRDPARLVLVDVSGAPGTQPRVVRTVPVPGAARHLQLAAPAGPLLVPGEDTDTVAVVDLPSGAVRSVAAVGRQPHDAAPVGTGPPYTAVVSEELGRATAVVRDGALVARLPGPLQPGGVAVSGGRADVVDVRGRLSYVYDVDPPRQVATVPAGAGPTHAVSIGDGVVIVADTAGGTLIVTRLTGAPAVLATVTVGAAPYALAYDGQRRRLWVGLTGSDTLREVAVTGPSDAPVLQPGRSLPTLHQPNSVAVWARTGRVVVAGATPQGTLQVIDP